MTSLRYWVKIHEQKPGDDVTFKRQAHAGSAFDSRRGRIIIFGSDTHGEDWSNSPLFFDVASLKWSRLYPDDDPSTYRVRYKSAGVFELDLRSNLWHQAKPSGLLGYGNNAVFDTLQRALVVFGSNPRSNDVVVYKPATKQQLRMSTPGVRPPRGKYNPMAFHVGIGRTVVLVDRAPEDKLARDLRKMQAETWLYDLGEDVWTQVRSATLPFGCGMNYNMAYDAAHNLLLLVANPPEEPTAVWALRL